MVGPLSPFICSQCSRDALICILDRKGPLPDQRVVLQITRGDDLWPLMMFRKQQHPFQTVLPLMFSLILYHLDFYFLQAGHLIANMNAWKVP